MATSCSLLRSTPRHVSTLPTLALSTCGVLPRPSSSSQTPSRYLATVNPGQRALPEVYCDGYGYELRVNLSATKDGGPQKPDERTVKLGKTLRVLQERLPTLLQSPLPQEILSPQITLHLFPSTHPHLPTVSGRIAYSAALWTSPLTWGRVPIVGNVKLEILSERMIKSPLSASNRPEQLVVRWKTIGKTRGKGVGAFYKGIGGTYDMDKITEFLGGGKGEDDSKEFTGLFMFEFDEEGRVVSHTIEHSQEGGNWERGVGARVVGLTDWLLGGMKRNGRDDGGVCPAFWVDGDKDNRVRRRRRI